MDEAIVKIKMEQAIEALFRRQPDIFDFTAETHQTEWNLAHHLANEIQGVFPHLQCDLEVVKANYENQRPDIVVHRRGTHKANYLIVEVKLDGTDSDLDSDTEKIRTQWFRPPLRYEFGAVIDLRTNGRHAVEVFKNG